MGESTFEWFAWGLRFYVLHLTFFHLLWLAQPLSFSYYQEMKCILFYVYVHTDKKTNMILRFVDAWTKLKPSHFYGIF